MHTLSSCPAVWQWVLSSYPCSDLPKCEQLSIYLLSQSVFKDKASFRISGASSDRGRPLKFSEKLFFVLQYNFWSRKLEDVKHLSCFSLVVRVLIQENTFLPLVGFRSQFSHALSHDLVGRAPSELFLQKLMHSADQMSDEQRAWPFKPVIRVVSFEKVLWVSGLCFHCPSTVIFHVCVI